MIRLGSLAPGRLASFIVTDGDPLETTTRVERVFIQGRKVSTANRQSPVASDRKVRTALPPDRPPLKLAHLHSDQSPRTDPQAARWCFFKGSRRSDSREPTAPTGSLPHKHSAPPRTQEPPAFGRLPGFFL